MKKKTVFGILLVLVLMFSVSVYAQSQVAPDISNPFPLDNASYVSLNPTLEVSIFDADGDSVDWTVGISDGENFVLLDSGSDADGQVNLAIPAGALAYDTQYSWLVSAIDSTGSGILTEKSYGFRTRQEANYAPIISNPVPEDGAVDILRYATLQADIYDVEGDDVDWTIELFNGGSWNVLNSGTSDGTNTSVSVTASSVNKYNTRYTWRVTAKDSGSNIVSVKSYNFTTKLSNTIPSISNVYPANESFDVPFNPNLTADIYDVDGKSLNWTVELFDGNTWVVLEEGFDEYGNISLSVPTSNINQYNSVYLWKITVVDSLGTLAPVEKVYSFTSRLEIYPPRILSSAPFDGETAVRLNSSVSVYVDEVYRDNKTFNVSFSVLEGDNWQVIGSPYSNVVGGNYSVSGIGRFTQPLTTYFWRVSVVDSAGQVAEEVFSFTTGGALTPKWNASIGNDIYGQIMPVMGDIDNDGTQEIVMSAGTNVVSVNGKTGVVEWSVSGGSGNAVELADVNNDGVLEVLFTTPDRRVVALRGDGSVLWRSVSLSGEGQPQFPLLAFDVDGDGFPTIYFASEDATPTTFSGNMSDYTGALSMLDHEGNFLRSTWLFHPCWGGLSIGDPNFDGNFVLYVSDRKTGYYKGLNDSKGLQAYDPVTLELLWNRGDYTSSSPLPVLVDVTKDGVLDVIFQAVTHRGLAVVNASSGVTYPGMNYMNRSLPTHGAGTVYDVDLDGNVEIILSVDSGQVYPKDFVVFDLVTGEEDFHPYFDFWVAWPPEVGDVLGDGDMEILAATGNQGWKSASYPLLVYDSDFVLVDRVDVVGAGQLMPAKVFDVDGDGLNEVVVASLSGRLMVYDTKVATPNPAPRTWVQRYSEYRRGVAEFVEIPGPKAPVVNDVFPASSSENIILEPTLSVRLYDYQKDSMSINFEINSGSDWNEIQNYNDVASGIYTANTTGYADEYGKTYSWRITATDVNGNINRQTYSFTTLGQNSTSYCGDGTCNENENCSSCNSDCGSCNTNETNTTPTSVPDCGDTICEGGETCSTCAADCGKCSSSGGGGGGGGSRSTSTSTSSTTQNATSTNRTTQNEEVKIVCSDWSSCRLGTQQRTCTGNKTYVEERICPEEQKIQTAPPSLLIVNDSKFDNSTLAEQQITGAVTGAGIFKSKIWIWGTILIIVSVAAVQIIIRRKKKYR